MVCNAAKPLSLLGHHDEAVAKADAAFRLCQDPGPRAYLGYVLASAGRIAEARAVLNDLQALEKNRYVTPTATAGVLVSLGEFDTALDQLLPPRGGQLASPLHPATGSFVTESVDPPGNARPERGYSRMRGSPNIIL